MKRSVIFKNTKVSDLLIEQHFHGCYGVDFSTCDVTDILELSKKLLMHGIGGFFPTLVTDSVENIKRQINIIKDAKANQTEDMAEILGIHIEGIFINPIKKGIHDENKFLKPTVKNFKLIEDDFIKIVTLAPELDEGSKLQKYLQKKGIKVQAGHCVGGDLNLCNGVTHTFNAMEGISHKKPSTALSALINNKLYAEIIADGIHVNSDALELFFNSKPKNKVIFVSDSLPIAQSDLKEMIFAGSKIYYDGKKATSLNGTLAGSTEILNHIVKVLSLKKPENFENYVKMASTNVAKYHKIKLKGKVWWDDKFNIIAVEKNNFVLCKQ
jgi:N-acetylglucosamine-6-phosphate deacetylase